MGFLTLVADEPSVNEEARLGSVPGPISIPRQKLMRHMACFLAQVPAVSQFIVASEGHCQLLLEAFSTSGESCVVSAAGAQRTSSRPSPPPLIVLGDEKPSRAESRTVTSAGNISRRCRSSKVWPRSRKYRWIGPPRTADVLTLHIIVGRVRDYPDVRRSRSSPTSPSFLHDSTLPTTQ